MIGTQEDGIVSIAEEELEAMEEEIASSIAAIAKLQWEIEKLVDSKGLTGEVNMSRFHGIICVCDKCIEQYREDCNPSNAPEEKKWNQ